MQTHYQTPLANPSTIALANVALPIDRSVCSVCGLCRGAALDEAMQPPVNGKWWGYSAARRYTRCIEQHSTRRISVPSRSRKGTAHTVTIAPGGAVVGCTCEARTYKPSKPCPHMTALMKGAAA